MYFMNKPFITLTLSSLIMSTIMAMSSSNWMFLWMSMEINMLSFIPLMTNTKANQETEAAIKYFMAQALGSSLMLMASMSHWSASFPLMNLILFSSIMLKLGMAPFHFWFPPVMTSMSWMACWILATWQKLAPLIILSFIMYDTSTLLITIVAPMNALLGGVMGMNQSHLRTIMAYSSITHMGWMTSMLSILKPHLTITYFIMYSLIISPLFLMFYVSEQKNVTQFNKINSSSPLFQLAMPVMLLSLSGMPPFTGFIPKWMAILALCQEAPFMLMIMIAGSMMNMYFYMNILFNTILTMNLSNIKSFSNRVQYPYVSIGVFVVYMFPMTLMYALIFLY